MSKKNQWFIIEMNSSKIIDVIIATSKKIKSTKGKKIVITENQKQLKATIIFEGI